MRNRMVSSALWKKYVFKDEFNLVHSYIAISHFIGSPECVQFLYSAPWDYLWSFMINFLGILHMTTQMVESTSDHGQSSLPGLSVNFLIC